jgi:hypothetical protein
MTSSRKKPGGVFRATMLQSSLLFMLAAFLWLSASLAAAPPAAEGTPPEKAQATSGNADADDGRAIDDQKKQRAEYVRQMRERSLKAIVRLAGNDDQGAQLNETPLFYFTDLPHNEICGGIWGWTVRGRRRALESHEV